MCAAVRGSVSLSTLLVPQPMVVNSRLYTALIGVAIKPRSPVLASLSISPFEGAAVK